MELITMILYSYSGAATYILFVTIMKNSSLSKRIDTTEKRLGRLIAEIDSKKEDEQIFINMIKSKDEQIGKLYVENSELKNKLDLISKKLDNIVSSQSQVDTTIN